jgi:hypothetical protein
MAAWILGAASCGPGLTITAPLTDAEWVCELVDECAQGGSNVWLQSCDAQALELQQQATLSGCAHPYGVYYACARSSFACQGITPLFPSCDEKRATLESCLAAATAQSACASYDAKLAACPGGSGRSPPGSPILAACSLNAQCQARCYLNSVANVCAPGLGELGAFSQCAQTCPP